MFLSIPDLDPAFSQKTVPKLYQNVPIFDLLIVLEMQFFGGTRGLISMTQCATEKICIQSYTSKWGKSLLGKIQQPHKTFAFLCSRKQQGRETGTLTLGVNHGQGVDKGVVSRCGIQTTRNPSARC
jgi:hypothetical protein